MIHPGFTYFLYRQNSLKFLSPTPILPHLNILDPHNLQTLTGVQSVVLTRVEILEDIWRHTAAVVDNENTLKRV